MKNVITAVAVIAAILVSGLVGQYIVESIQTKMEVDEIGRRAEDKASEPLLPVAEARAEFMQGCDTGDYTLQSEYCGCVWTELVTDYGVNQIMNDGLTLTAQQLESKYDKQINYCITTVYEGINL